MCVECHRYMAPIKTQTTAIYVYLASFYDTWRPDAKTFQTCPFTFQGCQVFIPPSLTTTSLPAAEFL